MSRHGYPIRSCAWRRVELNITEFIHNAFHYAEGLERFRDRIPVVPEGADGLKHVARDRTTWLDGMLTHAGAVPVRLTL